eukprot:COSAG03_NODE_21823_length_299_cov_0.390000_1_plen_35_part_01
MLRTVADASADGTEALSIASVAKAWSLSLSLSLSL